MAIGEPKPKGSMRAYTYTRSDGSKGAGATNDSVHTKPWQAVVAVSASMARHGVFFNVGVAVGVRVQFFFTRPRTVHRPFMTVKPDVDKLARAIGDALKGVLYVDDGQVTQWITEKRYAAPGHPARAEILVWRRDE